MIIDIGNYFFEMDSGKKYKKTIDKEIELYELIFNINRENRFKKIVEKYPNDLELIEKAKLLYLNNGMNQDERLEIIKDFRNINDNEKKDFLKNLDVKEDEKILLIRQEIDEISNINEKIMYYIGHFIIFKLKEKYDK